MLYNHDSKKLIKSKEALDMIINRKDIAKIFLKIMLSQHQVLLTID